MMREKQIEQKLVKAVKAEGGMCPKLVSPGTDGMPDRMVLLPEAHIGFVEVKAPGQKPRAIQERRHRGPFRSGGMSSCGSLVFRYRSWMTRSRYQAS